MKSIAYALAVGSLMYAMVVTRLDISHVVVKIFGHKRKLEGGEQIGAVQRMHKRG